MTSSNDKIQQMHVHLKPFEGMMYEGREVVSIVCKANQKDYEERTRRLMKHRKDVRVKVKCLQDGRIYDSVQEAAKEMGLSSGSISKCINGKQMSTHGYTFCKG